MPDPCPIRPRSRSHARSGRSAGTCSWVSASGGGPSRHSQPAQHRGSSTPRSGPATTAAPTSAPTAAAPPPPAPGPRPPRHLASVAKPSPPGQVHRGALWPVRLPRSTRTPLIACPTRARLGDRALGGFGGGQLQVEQDPDRLVETEPLPVLPRLNRDRLRMIQPIDMINRPEPRQPRTQLDRRQHRPTRPIHPLTIRPGEHPRRPITDSRTLKRRTLVAGDHHPALVDARVMEPAQQDQIGQISPATRRPTDHMMRLQMTTTHTARELTRLIPHHQRPPLRLRHQPPSPTQREHITMGIDDRAEHRAGAEVPPCRLGLDPTHSTDRAQPRPERRSRGNVSGPNRLVHPGASDGSSIV